MLEHTQTLLFYLLEKPRDKVCWTGRGQAVFLVHLQLLSALGWEQVSLCRNRDRDPGIPPGHYCHTDGGDALPGARLCLLGLFLVAEAVLWLKLGVQFDFSLPKPITNFSSISVVKVIVTGKRFLGRDLAGQVITAVVT